LSQNQPPSIPPYQGGGIVPAQLADGLSPSLDKGRAGEGLAFDLEAGFVFDTPYLPYNKKLTALARENRSKPTTAENRIWQKVLCISKLEVISSLKRKKMTS